jgi:twinkle protein
MSEAFKEEQKAHLNAVKAALASNIEAFCRQYLSRGKRVGTMWHVGSPENNRDGDSLKIYLEGQRRGSGYYNAENQSLGPIDLWMRATGTEFKDALQQASDWVSIPKPVYTPGGGSAAKPVKLGWQRMGGRSEGVEELRKEVAAKPVLKKDFKDIVEGSAAWQYLTVERGLDGDALRRARVGEGDFWMPQHDKVVPCWCVPSYDPSGERLLAVKYFALERVLDPKTGEYKKDVRAQKGSENHLQGQHLIDPGRDVEVFLAEGETDWLSFLSEGKAALSVPFGAQADGPDGRENAGNRWLQNDWEFLEQIQGMIVVFDHDRKGAAATETILRRLPETMVRKVARVKDLWPDAPDKSDVNDLLLRDPMNIHYLVQHAEEVSPAELARVRDMRDKIWIKLFGRDGEAEGFEVHGLGDHLRWRLGEWTLVTGYEGHGKTTWLGHQIVDLAAQHGVRACIASLEADPAKNFSVLFQQAMGCVRPVKLPSGDPDEAWFERCVDWMQERVFCYNKVGFVKLSDVLKLFAYTAKRFGCRVFVVDSLMMLQSDLDMGESANEREKQMCQLLKIFCETYDAHVFLVAHPKKVQEEKTQIRKPVRPQDVRGAGEIANLCFNLVSVYMNDAKLFGMRDTHEALRLLEDQAGDFDKADLDKMNDLRNTLADLETEHDSTLYCMKQRNAVGDFIKPMRRLWFHPSAKQLWHEPEREVEVYVR